MTTRFGFVLALLFVFATGELHADAISRTAREALQEVIPEGYRTAAVTPCATEVDGHPTFVAALVDADEEQPHKVVRLLYLTWNGRWRVLDGFTVTTTDPELPPQYLSGLSLVRVGQVDLLFVYTTWFGGGSGSRHYYQFFDIRQGRLTLLRSFELDRMERGLLTLRNDRIYFADIVCKRGNKRGQSFEYSCYLDTKELSFDGKAIVLVRTEQLEPRKGNRYLSETYWNISLRSILRRGGHFPNPP